MTLYIANLQVAVTFLFPVSLEFSATQSVLMQNQSCIIINTQIYQLQDITLEYIHICNARCFLTV